MIVSSIVKATLLFAYHFPAAASPYHLLFVSGSLLNELNMHSHRLHYDNPLLQFRQGSIGRPLILKDARIVPVKALGHTRSVLTNRSYRNV
jgi:hypothetical protein